MSADGRVENVEGDAYGWESASNGLETRCVEGVMTGNFRRAKKVIPFHLIHQSSCVAAGECNIPSNLQPSVPISSPPRQSRRHPREDFPAESVVDARSSPSLSTAIFFGLDRPGRGIVRVKDDDA